LQVELDQGHPLPDGSVVYLDVQHADARIG
jgi:hypothetical protein